MSCKNCTCEKPKDLDDLFFQVAKGTGWSLRLHTKKNGGAPEVEATFYSWDGGSYNMNRVSGKTIRGVLEGILEAQCDPAD